MLAEAAICADNLFRSLFPEVLWKSTDYHSHGTVVLCQEQIKWQKPMIYLLTIQASVIAGQNYRL